VPPRPTRELVLKAAGSGNLLPPKSTRHITMAKKVVAAVRLLILISLAPGFYDNLARGAARNVINDDMAVTIYSLGQL